jgi:hypothetical protein
MVTEKITVVKKASDFVEGSKDMWQFFTDMRHEGFWYAATGQHFGPWLRDTAYAMLDYSDILIVVAMILAVLIVAGSGRAKKYLWWCFLAYLVSKSLQLHLA